MNKLAALALLGTLSVAAGAQQEMDNCPPAIHEALGREMKGLTLSPPDEGGNLIAAVCRNWPYQPSSLLTAIAYDAGVEAEKQLLLAIVDAKTMRVLNRFQTSVSEDAVTEIGASSLSLDTARYQLASQVRAFGLRFNSVAHGANCADFYWGDELTLFVPEGKTLRPVLTLNLYQQRWLKGCPAATTSALWEDARLTISIGKGRSKGFQDLEITARIAVNASGPENAAQQDRRERHTLRYDGRAYQKGKDAPWWLGF